MSDSRLEKFIYAICSMDVSDLPVPLSRIEKLWNCLITGETPDFEPLSRNEKYLMAMLDRYDISNLPAPMSRGEKLLYKIAVGETDLSDVPGYLSRYEELLKYLIENGGISEGDFEYVLHTLNQALYTIYSTAEKPVKSAILKGQTLINIKENQVSIGQEGRQVEYEIPLVKINTKYFIKYKLTSTSSWVAIGFLNNSLSWSSNRENQPLEGQFILNSGTNPCYFRIGGLAGTTTTVDYLMIIEYQEGMENWNIPYFEGMQSVKMPVLTTTNGSANILTDSQLNDKTGEIEPHNNSNKAIEDYILIPNNPITVSNAAWLKISFYDANKVYISNTGGTNINKFELNDTTIPVNAKYFRFHYNSASLPLIRFVNGTDYIKATIDGESFKTNILTVNEDVTLHGIGKVKDELDLLTGELTQRLINMSNLGDYDMPNYTVHDVTNYSSVPVLKISFDLPFKIVNTGYGVTNNFPLVCDKFKILGDQNGYSVDRGSYVSSRGNQLVLHLIKEEVGLPTDKSITKEIVKEFLKENPIEVTSRLVEPVIKTVDLTVVDQDNQPTQLGTFENVTRVSLEAENLIPEVEMEVATNLLEDTVFNLTNAFNTLYPTAEKPVKSAILSGNTLVNLCDKTKSVFSADGNKNLWQNALFNTNPTQLTIINYTDKVIKFSVHDRTTDKWISTNGINPNSKLLVNCGTDKYLKDLYGAYGDGWSDTEEDRNILKDGVLILEGDHTQEDIPYFEGMQSVKMPVLMTTGKNLFNKEGLVLQNKKRVRADNGEFVYSTASSGFDNYFDCQFLQGKTINVSSIATGNEGEIAFYTIDKTYIKGGNLAKSQLVPENAFYYRFSISVLDTSIDEAKIQIEVNSVATLYEPIKSNILTVNEDVTLRGIDDVKDELNLLTGELTQRIGLALIDGTVNGTLPYGHGDPRNGTICLEFATKSPIFTDGPAKNSSTPYISQQLPYRVGIGVDYSCIAKFSIPASAVIVRVPGNTAEEAKDWLKNNPVTFIYELATPIIKTVDLTVVDQDGNVTTLKTFDDTTHVLLNSKGLIPTAVLTVRTKIPSGSSTSLLMDDISTEQQQLNETVNEQSENVDATMIATTEIFEETL